MLTAPKPPKPRRLDPLPAGPGSARRPAAARGDEAERRIGAQARLGR